MSGAWVWVVSSLSETGELIDSHHTTHCAAKKRCTILRDSTDFPDVEYRVTTYPLYGPDEEVGG